LSGYEIALGTCWACGRPFTFNADRVPSIPIDPERSLPLDVNADGSPRAFTDEERARAIKEPICSDCIALANANRRANGQPEIHVLPGAYEAR